MRRTWYVYRPVTLLAQAPPDECLTMLRDATKPSKERLHLQELFVSGRRYVLEPHREGFTMLTNSKAYWRYTEGVMRVRRRTRSSARMHATLSPLSTDFTRIELRSHIRAGYLLNVIFLPAFFTSIILPMPWAWWVIALLVISLFGLSFLYHYTNAAYQANEMVFFVQKVLMDKLVTSLPTLSAENPDVVRAHADFEREWERFYNAHRTDD